MSDIVITSKNIQSVDIPIYKVHSTRFKYNVPSLRAQPFELLKPKVIALSDSKCNYVLESDMVIWGIAKLAAYGIKINIFADDEPLFNTKINTDNFPTANTPVYQLPVSWCLRKNQQIRIEADAGTFNIALYAYFTKIDREPLRFPYLYVADFGAFTNGVEQNKILYCRADYPYYLTSMSQVATAQTNFTLKVLINSTDEIINNDPFLVLPNPSWARRFYIKMGLKGVIQLTARKTDATALASYDVLVGGYYEKPKEN